MLYFDAEKFEFWKIYDTIRHFYPIGVDTTTHFYRSYAGQIEFAQLLSEKVHDAKEFQKWEEFNAAIDNDIKKEIVGTTYGQAPAFSSFVQEEKETTGNLTRIKDIGFFVSVLGPYYTIIGRDRIEIRINDILFFSTNYLIVSPENEFSSTFDVLSRKIEEHFKGYRFVPFHIYNQMIEGLKMWHAEDNQPRVFYALFNNQVDLDTTNILGDTMYKSDDWIRPGYIDDGARWTAYPPGVSPDCAT